MTLRRVDGPGKFEGCMLVEVAVYVASLDGCCDVVGDDNGGESYTRVDGPMTGIDLEQTDQAERDHLLDSIKSALIGTDAPEDPTRLNSDELAFMARQAGAIVYESTQGFVSVEFFRAADELEANWEAIVKVFAPFDDDDCDA